MLKNKKFESNIIVEIDLFDQILYKNRRKLALTPIFENQIKVTLKIGKYTKIAKIMGVYQAPRLSPKSTLFLT